MPWLALPLGLLTGSVMGALGGGGAILTIPVLIYVLGMEPHTATTASLLIVGIGAAASVVGQWRHRTVRALDAFELAATGLLGTYAGSRASAAVSPAVLVVLLAALLAVVGGLMLRRAAADASGAHGAAPQEGHAAAVPEPAAPGSASRGRHVVAIVAVGMGVGLLTGFFGVGGGFAIVPALTLVLGYPVRTAVGTSLLVIALNSATALASRLGHGVDLDWKLVAVFTVGSVLGGFAGGAVGRRTSSATMSTGFAILLFMVAAYMLVQAVLAR